MVGLLGRVVGGAMAGVGDAMVDEAKANGLMERQQRLAELQHGLRLDEMRVGNEYQTGRDAQQHEYRLKEHGASSGAAAANIRLQDQLARERLADQRAYDEKNANVYTQVEDAQGRPYFIDRFGKPLPHPNASLDRADTAADARRDVAATRDAGATQRAQMRLDAKGAWEDATDPETGERILVNTATKDVKRWPLDEKGKPLASETAIAKLANQLARQDPSVWITDQNGKPVFDTKGHQRVDETRVAELTQLHRQKLEQDLGAKRAERLVDPNAWRPVSEDDETRRAMTAPLGGGDAVSPPRKAPLSGGGTKDDPFKASTQADIDWFKASAPAGAVISVNGKLYKK